MENIKKLQLTNIMEYDSEDTLENTLRKFIKRSLVCITPERTIKDAAKLMHKENVSSVVVIKNEIPVGIITDSDLRRLIAEGYDVENTIDDLLKRKLKKQYKLITVDIDESVNDALSKMLEHRIKHTIVTENGKPRGMVTIGDITYRLAPFYIYHVIRLRRAKKIDEIKDILEEFKGEVIRHAEKFSKNPEEGRVDVFFEAISYVVDATLKTLVDMIGEIPENFVYCASGSWGRREQFILTDRDTLVIYREEEDKDEYDALIDEVDIRSFVDEIEECMDEVGFPPCPHGYTSRNLFFSLGDLMKKVDKWCDSAEKNAVIISILADSRAILGDEKILHDVKLKLVEKMHRNILFVGHSLIYKPPISFMGLSKSFDFKSRAIAPIEYPVRALAITNRVVSTSTQKRIEELGKIGVISNEMTRDLILAYNIIMRFKIMVQSKLEDELDVSKLSSIEKKMLEDALRIVKLFQEYVEKNYS
jgi:CBS domain-containing protein